MRVVYGEKMVADQLHHISPSSYKPRLLVAHLRQLGLPLELHEPVAVSREDLCLAHHPEYVNNVLDCIEENGFGNKDPDVAATLPYTSGSFYQACLLALQHGMAASFTSGFHHARYSNGGGFCTFNGLMVAARRLFMEQKVKRLLILDLDYHYGDGTDDILNTLQVDYVRHETFGDRFKRTAQAVDYLQSLERILDSLEPVDLVLYQAGADVHIDDPLGGLLTTEQMARRDRLVFTATHRLGLPVAWNLAGGYRRDENDTILPVLKLHEQTYRIALEIYAGA